MFDLFTADKSWQSILKQALTTLPPNYESELANSEFLPASSAIFNAFSLPLNKVNYILFGETPYPRAISANGYAFWDAAVDQIWSTTGLSKAVNRATSLRNFIKMLLVANGLLTPPNLSQDDIANIDKSHLIKTLPELFKHFYDKGVLLLNASLVLRTGKKNTDGKIWQPFMNHILAELYQRRPHVQLILFGQIAKAIDNLPASKPYKKLISEHPYNYSFIFNAEVQQFFQPWRLLQAD